MNVLSLFDGMSCGMLALQEAGITPNKYYASEIDPYAIKISQANFPEIVQLGDIEQWEDWDIDWSSIDLLIGGFPCQSFSTAGEHGGFEDPRGNLFFHCVDILNHVEKVNPDIKYLFENVKMSKTNVSIITEKLFFATHSVHEWESIA